MCSTDQKSDRIGQTKAPRRSYSMSYKMRILEEYDASDGAGKAALRRREGLCASRISDWRRERAARSLADARRREIARLRARIAQLEGKREFARKVIAVYGMLSALLEELITGTAATNRRR